MDNDFQIFQKIKSEVRVVLPAAQIFLFGSRAEGNATEESDWDILILVPETPDKKTKRLVHDALFPVSISIGAFINTTIASENDWRSSPSYYALRRSLSSKA